MIITVYAKIVVGFILEIEMNPTQVCQIVEYIGKNSKWDEKGVQVRAVFVEAYMGVSNHILITMYLAKMSVFRTVPIIKLPDREEQLVFFLEILLGDLAAEMQKEVTNVLRS